MRVNLGRSRRIDWAVGPLPSTMSMTKSSIAEYRTSSTTRDSRWISSMKNTSPGSRLERMAARSPGRSRAGPEVICRVVPISAATIPASVVFPRPGGPERRMWSSDLPSARAASIEIHSLSLTRSWPMNSSRRRGRRVISISSSAVGLSTLSSRTASLPQQLECGLHLVLHTAISVHLGEHLVDLLGAGAELFQCHPLLGGPASLDHVGFGVGELGAQLEDDPLGGALPHAGSGRQRPRVLAEDRPAQLIGPQRRQQ